MSKNIPIPARTVLTDPIHFLAFGFGSGLSPKAPGTMGSLMALLPWWFMKDLENAAYLGILLVTSLLGIWLCGRSSEKLGVHDHSGIVWDEFVGMWITLYLVPQQWPWILAAFALFRFFDILKPWPIRWLDQKVHGGFGIMVDDMLAGLFALGLLQGAVLVL